MKGQSNEGPFLKSFDLGMSREKFSRGQSASVLGYVTQQEWIFIMTYSFLRNFLGQGIVPPGIAVDLLQCFSANCLYATFYSSKKRVARGRARRKEISRPQ
jgi:hypothetical protein